MLGTKTMENEVLREAVTRAAGPKKTAVALELVAGGRTVSAAATATGVSRPHLSATLHAGPRPRRGRPPQPDGELVAAIGTLIADLPTYGYRRIHAVLRRQAEASARAAPNPKRVNRVMKLHALLLQRAGTRNEQRRHDGRVAVDIRNTR